MPAEIGQLYGRAGAVELTKEFLSRPHRDGAARSRRQPVLVFTGPHGSGKTALLDKLEEWLQPLAPYARIDCATDDLSSSPRVLSALVFELNRTAPVRRAGLSALYHRATRLTPGTGHRRPGPGLRPGAPGTRRVPQYRRVTRFPGRDRRGHLDRAAPRAAAPGLPYRRQVPGQTGRGTGGAGPDAPDQPIRSLRQGSHARALREARTCYNHLAAGGHWPAGRVPERRRAGRRGRRAPPGPGGARPAVRARP